MPAIAPAWIAILVTVAAVAALAGWLLRGRRCAAEKIAVNAGWQHQIDAQQAEHDRLAAQNTHLMEQLSQQQSRASEAQEQARQLNAQLEGARTNHDDLQRQIREIRGNLELALVQRDKLRSNSVRSEAVSSAIRERDEKIARLKRELGRWQERVPPLVERYRQRDLEAQQLEIELERAKSRIAQLETGYAADETRVEPMQSAPLNNLDASNDQFDEPEEEPADAPPSAAGNIGHDDLKRIKGIGPAIEKTLHRLGFTRFSQIAVLSDYDIDRIAAELRGFRTRIQREDWIGQARMLQEARDPT